MKKIKKSKTETDNEKVITPVKYWPARLRATLVVLLSTYLFAASIVVLKNDLINKKIEEIKNSILDFVGAKELALEDVVVTGRKRTSLEDILKKINIKQGDNLLKADVGVIKYSLEELPWIRDVEVRRSFFPNVLKINITEKEILAVWQLKGQFYPLDMDGYVIEADYVQDKEVLQIVGEGAGENILSLLRRVEDIDESFVSRIKIASFISKRRWNLVLDDAKKGVTVKLPEQNFEQAWKKLLNLEKTKGILKRKLTIIDLRLDDKVIVKLQKEDKSKKKREHQI